MSEFNYRIEHAKDGLDFGDFCTIEQKRYGADNEFYLHKVIGRSRANYYRPVPVDANDAKYRHGDMCEVVHVICCGVQEKDVQTFRVQDVHSSRSPLASKDADIAELVEALDTLVSASKSVIKGQDLLPLGWPIANAETLIAKHKEQTK